MKINDTNFNFNNLDINIKGQAFIAVSKLNEARRNAIEKHENDLIARFHRKSNLKREEVKEYSRKDQCK